MPEKAAKALRRTLRKPTSRSDDSKSKHWRFRAKSPPVDAGRLDVGHEPVRGLGSQAHFE